MIQAPPSNPRPRSKNRGNMVPAPPGGPRPRSHSRGRKSEHREHSEHRHRKSEHREHSEHRHRKSERKKHEKNDFKNALHDPSQMFGGHATTMGPGNGNAYNAAPMNIPGQYPSCGAAPMNIPGQCPCYGAADPQYANAMLGPYPADSSHMNFGQGQYNGHGGYDSQRMNGAQGQHHGGITNEWMPGMTAPQGYGNCSPSGGLDRFNSIPPTNSTLGFSVGASTGSSILQQNTDPERKATLQAIASFFKQPETFGVSRDVRLVPLHGFQLEQAEFEPHALKRPTNASKFSNDNGYPNFGASFSNSFPTALSPPARGVGGQIPKQW